MKVAINEAVKLGYNLFESNEKLKNRSLTVLSFNTFLIRSKLKNYRPSRRSLVLTSMHVNKVAYSVRRKKTTL